MQVLENADSAYAANDLPVLVREHLISVWRSERVPHDRQNGLGPGEADDPSKEND